MARRCSLTGPSIRPEGCADLILARFTLPRRKNSYPPITGRVRVGPHGFSRPQLQQQTLSASKKGDDQFPIVIFILSIYTE